MVFQRFEHELEATSMMTHLLNILRLARTNYRYQKELVTKVAKEFAQNAIDTGGRSMIIMGLVSTIGLTPDTIYRSILNLVLLWLSRR